LLLDQFEGLYSTCKCNVLEYSSQLPTEGGAFYTFDTMDTARPHYRKAWTPILYAAALWLRETGFTSVDKDNSRPANMKADDSDISRFHLLMGESGVEKGREISR